jgi:EAL domain-containing protein (putative c-di-GMP-specific phosphodiesterase class I)
MVKPLRLNDLRVHVACALADARHPTSPTSAPTGSARDTLLRELAERLDGPTQLACIVVALDNLHLYRAAYGAHAVARLHRDVSHLLHATDSAIEVLGVADHTVVAACPLEHLRSAERLGDVLADRLVPTADVASADRLIAVRPAIGIAAAHTHQPAHLLLEQAEAAAATASQLDSPRVATYHDTITHEVRAELDLISDLRAAVQTHEIAVHYQPQVDIRTGRWTGLEALARWNHPTRGAINPTTFIPLAERVGLIDLLGKLVLETACAQHAHLRQHLAGAPRILAVNVSALQLSDPNFPDLVDACLTRNALSAADLYLEITESTLLTHGAPARQTLHVLARQGIGLAVDDFGAGYSSFAYLTDLPWTQLKIDRTITQQSDTPAGREIVRAILQLADALHLDVIAEGVEHDLQRAILATLGCQYAQGFLWANPQPYEQLEAQITSRHSPSPQR